jgi:hypothetical protein
LKSGRTELKWSVSLVRELLVEVMGKGEMLTSLPRLKSWDSRVLMPRPVGFGFHRAPDGVSLHAL